jgi:serine/threonine protein kinase
MVAAAPAAVGVIAHYNLLERLAPAGPGELYRARDTRLGRTVAVRLLPDSLLPDAAARVRLLEQAQIIRSLSHPNTTALFDAGEHEGRCYLVFEFLKGKSLRAEMGGAMMNVRRSVEIAIHIADAVADAHAAGFSHGGLSPESVVITAKGQAKIPALDLATREGFDESGLRLRDYESPEEGRGEAPDERSDVFSIGAILYEMLTARRPPHRGAAAPSATNPRIPPELDRIVLAAVAPNPDLRCPSAARLASDLRAIVAGLDILDGAGDEPGTGHAAASAPSPIPVIVASVVVLALLVLLVWSWAT